MAAAEALRAGALAAIVVLLWLGRLDLVVLAVLGFVSVCGTVVFRVARSRWCLRSSVRASFRSPMRVSNWRARSPLWAAAGLFAAQAALIWLSPVARLEERPGIA